MLTELRHAEEVRSTSDTNSNRNILHSMFSARNLNDPLVAGAKNGWAATIDHDLGKHKEI